MSTPGQRIYETLRTNVTRWDRLTEEERARYEAAADAAWEPRPGEMHPVDRAFYELVVAERDYERARVDRLTARG